MSFIWIKTFNYLSRVLVLCGDWGSPKRIFVAFSPIFPIFHPFSLQTWCSSLPFGVLDLQDASGHPKCSSWLNLLCQVLPWVFPTPKAAAAGSYLGIPWKFFAFPHISVVVGSSPADGHLPCTSCPLLVFTGIEEVLGVILCFVSCFIFILLFNAFINIILILLWSITTFSLLLFHMAVLILQFKICS